MITSSSKITEHHGKKQPEVTTAVIIQIPPAEETAEVPEEMIIPVAETVEVPEEMTTPVAETAEVPEEMTPPAAETAEVPEEMIILVEAKNLAAVKNLAVEKNLAAEMTAAIQNRIMAEMAAVRMSLQNQ